jgi:hypothetical protein
MTKVEFTKFAQEEAEQACKFYGTVRDSFREGSIWGFDQGVAAEHEKLKESRADCEAIYGELLRYKNVFEMFTNRRKLAHSLRNESHHIAAFVEAIGAEIDKILAERELGGAK